MTSKKLGALLRSAPHATAAPIEQEVSQPQSSTLAPAPAVSGPAAKSPRKAEPELTTEPEVSLQVLIPANIRRELAIKAAERGESLRALVLTAIRGLGVEVTDADIRGKRGRRNS